MSSRNRRHFTPPAARGRAWRVAGGLALIAMALLPVLGDDKSDKASPKSEQLATTAARLVTIHLPLRGSEVEQSISQLQAAVARLPKDGNTRPLLILEFASSEGTAGEGTM